MRPGRGPRGGRRRARRGRGHRHRRLVTARAGAAVWLASTAARRRRSSLTLRHGHLGRGARGLGHVDWHLGLIPRRGERHRAADGRRGRTAIAAREGLGDRPAQRLAQLRAQRERLRVPRFAFARVREHHLLHVSALGRERGRPPLVLVELFAQFLRLRVPRFSLARMRERLRAQLLGQAIALRLQSTQRVSRECGTSRRGGHTHAQRPPGRRARPCPSRPTTGQQRAAPPAERRSARSRLVGEPRARRRARSLA